MHFALLVGAVVALLLSAFLLFIHTSNFFAIQSKEVLHLVDETNNILIKNIDGSQLIFNDTINQQAGKLETKETYSFSGCWIKKRVTTKNKEKQFTHNAYLGGSHTLKTPNLYLKNSSAPLVVVGNTKIYGNSYLPEEGIKAGNISGNYYQNRKLVYGNAFISKETLPELNKDWLQYIKKLNTNNFLENQNIVELKEVMKNSFHDPVKIVYSASPITISGHQLKGNIIIKSASSIRIDASSDVTDVIFIAPKITISSGVKGTFQAIAKEKITVGRNCKLKYPSSLVIYTIEKEPGDFDSTATENTILINSYSIIQGSVVYFEEKKPITENTFRRGVQTHLKIETNAKVTGEVYVTGNTELLGTVEGSLYTNQLVANQYGSKYINHIYNGKILLNNAPNYTGLFFKDASLALSKWLY